MKREEAWLIKDSKEGTEREVLFLRSIGLIEYRNYNTIAFLSLSRPFALSYCIVCPNDGVSDLIRIPIE